MKNKNISARANSEAHDYLGDNFQTKSAGAEIAINSFKPLREYTLRELQGRFEGKEKQALAASFSKTKMDESWMASKSIILAHLEDSNNINGLAAKWGLDWKKFIEKIKLLTAAQLFFLMLENRQQP